MDIAYDHIQEEILTSSSNNNSNSQPDGKDSNTASSSTTTERPNLNLSEEFQDSFRAISAEPWGARLGGFFSTIQRQGESYYAGARQEYSHASEEAIKGFTDLKETIVGRTRGLSLGPSSGDGNQADKEGEEGASKTPTSAVEGEGSNSKEEKTVDGENPDTDGDGFISRFRAEAAKRLKDIEKAEDAADEALLKFGTNVRNFLRDAVSVAPPNETDGNNPTSGNVLFESKDGDGKRVIHTTRFEAQLHAIHSNLDSLSKDPVSEEWNKWKDTFEIDNKTKDIATDLDTYPELRRAMEQLVPEKVGYADFWCRYYFLRLVIETEEKRRKELLKASTANDDEEVAWDEDSDSDSESPSTPQVKISKANLPAFGVSSAEAGSAETEKNNDSLQPVESRRSNDQQSQADSDASYDLVSGTTSRAPESPKDKGKPSNTASKADESDEEDWE